MGEISVDAEAQTNDRYHFAKAPLIILLFIKKISFTFRMKMCNILIYSAFEKLKHLNDKSEGD